MHNMKNLLRLLIIPLLIFSQIDEEIYNFIEKENIPSISASIVKNGQIIWMKSYGYANDHIQTVWSQMFKNGELKSIYSKYYDQMKIKLAYTIDQWINNVDKHLISDENDDW